MSEINSKKIKVFSSFLNSLAKDLTRLYYKKLNKPFKVNNKIKGKGYDPVTSADKAFEKFIRAKIQKKFPDHQIIGEEFGHKKVKSDFAWIIDPIDGTRAFILDIPIWGTLIAYNDGSRSVLGVADLPALGKRFAGYNDKSYDISDGKETPIFANKDIELEDLSLIHI